MWQIDFKGDFGMAAALCYPLTLLDDHSCFNLALKACPSVGMDSVQPHLVQAFTRYGLPVRVNADLEGRRDGQWHYWLGRQRVNRSIEFGTR